MSQQQRRSGQRSAPLKFVLLTLGCWGVLASVVAVILRLIYGAFTFYVVFATGPRIHSWFPAIDFWRWHWFFKGLYLGATLLAALGVVYGTVFPLVDAKDSQTAG